MLLMRCMMMNLFIAVIIEGFSSTNKEHTGTVNSKDFNQLIETWTKFDTNATRWINMHDIIYLVNMLDEPLGGNLKQKFGIELND